MIKKPTMTPSSYDVTNVLRVSSDELPPDGLHFQNTMSVTMTGTGAARIPFDKIRRHLPHVLKGDINYNDFVTGYRLELPFKFYFVMKPHVDIDRLHGTQFQIGECTGVIQNANCEDTKVTIHWVPVTFGPDMVKRVVGTFSGDQEVTSIRQMDAPYADKWTVMLNVRNLDVPHYVTLEVDGEKRLNMMVTVPGRKTACKLCGLTSHWFSQCPHRRRNQDDQEIGPIFPPPQPQYPQHSSYAAAATQNPSPAVPDEEDDVLSGDSEVIPETQLPANEPREQSPLPTPYGPKTLNEAKHGGLPSMIKRQSKVKGKKGHHSPKKIASWSEEVDRAEKEREEQKVSTPTKRQNAREDDELPANKSICLSNSPTFIPPSINLFDLLSSENDIDHNPLPDEDCD